MPRGFDANRFNRQMRAAQRKAEAEWKREIDRVNRENKRRVDAHNRKVVAHNKKVVTNYNRHVAKVNAHNAAVIADLNRQLRASPSGPRYTAMNRRSLIASKKPLLDAIPANGTHS